MDWKVEVAGKPLACLVCGHDRFGRGPLLGFGFLVPQSAEFDCRRCGFRHTFGRHSKLRIERAR